MEIIFSSISDQHQFLVVFLLLFCFPLCYISRYINLVVKVVRQTVCYVDHTLVFNLVDNAPKRYHFTVT